MTNLRRTATRILSLDECKIRASLLLKDLGCDDPFRAARAAERFRVLPAFALDEPAALVERRDIVQRKHALAVIAAELGYPTWADCKRRLEKPAISRVDTELFFARCGGFLNRWFARYPEARAVLDAEGGYLFPFRHQFFVCEWAFLEQLGIDPADPDWQRMEHDWVRPADEAARDRLEAKLVALGYAPKEQA